VSEAHVEHFVSATGQPGATWAIEAAEAPTSCLPVARIHHDSIEGDKGISIMTKKGKIMAEIR